MQSIDTPIELPYSRLLQFNFRKDHHVISVELAPRFQNFDIIDRVLFFPERESQRFYTLPAVYTLMTWQVRRWRALFVRGHPVRDASEKVREIKARLALTHHFRKN